MPDADVETRKLVVLGLPWETEKETLHQYFAQFGPVQESVIMKDRFTGKSRGFGFVTYVHQADAQNTAALEHQIDGRRCEAKVALPRGGTHPNRTTRIFVARIPPTVQDAQFRSYFEQFGRVQDAYMPKDAFKQAHRGIGFVTYATAEPVEQVMSTAHSLHGQELAVDRATPKEKATLPPSHSSNRLSQQLASAFSPPHSSGQLPRPAAACVQVATPAQLRSLALACTCMWPADAQAGPRIFVGKLNKDTTEADVRDHFTRFGYVMDVYMPRDKLNRSEHRGFGFVTFETEAALQRVRSQAPHQIKGSVVAIDAAEPRKEIEPLHFPDEEVSGMLCHSHLSDMARFALHGDELGPSRHHPFDRQRYNYRPY
eukprot:jgi/Astpho2/126/e_gw1.00004.19.1_t